MKKKITIKKGQVAINCSFFIKKNFKKFVKLF